ncbi:hypothetical protein [Paracraurococcus lichenis]|uniref:Uncharacterized protein n=1 Tax=Paracraurococcus lichenis TaxID=3064888 RepID=A0ABT9DXS4_9PROT|nr:hypothetical protein [Paracraurococcus sp. LOR1-02]MDO9708697.1 hypothetical protein [Paracraurococcus sp. LOR1-02]
MTAAAKPAHRRAVQAGQRAFIVFGGEADQPWLRLLRPGFRHCFAAIADARGWTVLDPLSGRLVVVRLEVPPQFDLPGFYRRAGFSVTGPFVPGAPRWRPLPPLSPFTCVALCRAVLGAGAPFALTPWGLFRALADNRKKYLTRLAAAR